MQCAPHVAPSTMNAIVQVESGGNPLAMNINGEQRLARQPKDKQEASRWAAWLISHGYSVDLGLAQVNSRNLQRLGVTAAQMFEPCDNLKSGAKILTENYAAAARQLGPERQATAAAISAYNTGNYRSGISNGYVAKVAAAANGTDTDAPPLVATKKSSGATRANLADSGSAKVVWVKRY